MQHLTIVGAGVQGLRMADKYRGAPAACVLRAISSPHRPEEVVLKGTPYVSGAHEWLTNFGRPSKRDVFDIQVHPELILQVVESYVAIGAKNFILPKPVALSEEGLESLRALIRKNRLAVVVASQWHYSALVTDIKRFVEKNKKKIVRVDSVSQGTFDNLRQQRYTAASAFLPHQVQVLLDTGIVEEFSMPLVEEISRESSSCFFEKPYRVSLRSNINSSRRQEFLKIYLKGDTDPALVADFSRKVVGGSIRYPSLTIKGKTKHIKEDVLEKMRDAHCDYFSKVQNGSVLTFDTYLPVARLLVNLYMSKGRTVMVVGGGIFGMLSAVEIAKKGLFVILFEKEQETLKGASLVNQCRVHMGYHYPRDKTTVLENKPAQKEFEKRFKSAIVTDLENHYLIAKEHSLTSSDDFRAFCDELGLPYALKWPKGIKFKREKISESFNVPERSFDANTLRALLLEEGSKLSNLMFCTGTIVRDITPAGDEFQITYQTGKDRKTFFAKAVVNATYSNSNRLQGKLGITLPEYQYELCEMPVVETPWNKKVGWSIMDGPFFGVMPFGFSDESLFYDVELSVLERYVGVTPRIKNSIAKYDTKASREKRFKSYIKKWSSWIENLEKCKYKYSLYTLRVVIPKKDKTDARPTLINQLVPGFWQIFSGKITTSVPQAIALADVVQKHFQEEC